MEETIQYWNEYDHGSDDDEGYALYVTPDEEGFPGWAYISAPFVKAKAWLERGNASGGEETRGEEAPLLWGASANYASIPGPGSSTDGEDLSSDDDLPREGYRTHFALPSLEEQQLRQYREHVLFWATASCLVVAGLLTLVAGVLLAAGRRKRRVEVEAGVMVGVVAGAFAAVAAMAMALARGGGGWVWKGIVGFVAVGVLVLDGMLLVLVVQR